MNNQYHAVINVHAGDIEFCDVTIVHSGSYEEFISVETRMAQDCVNMAKEDYCGHLYKVETVHGEEVLLPEGLVDYCNDDILAEEEAPFGSTESQYWAWS